MRAIGLDVDRDFCEVATVEGGELRSAGRVETRPEAFELFAQSLAPSDRVALEVSGAGWEIARLLEPDVARVIVVSPHDTGMSQARAKTDGSTHARSRGCSRRDHWMRCGCQRKGRAGCAGASRGERSSFGRARVQGTRSTPASRGG